MKIHIENLMLRTGIQQLTTSTHELSKFKSLSTRWVMIDMKMQKKVNMIYLCVNWMAHITVSIINGKNMTNNHRTYVHHSSASSNSKQMSIYSFLAINFHRRHHEIAMNSNVNFISASSIHSIPSRSMVECFWCRKRLFSDITAIYQL